MDHMLRMSCCSTEAGDTARVELTDGWYSVRALLDPPLSALLASGRLRIGTPMSPE